MRILDCLKENLSIVQVTDITKEFDVVGITLFTKDLAICKQYLKSIKKAKPSIITLLGGPHPSAVPDETLMFFKNLADYIFVGESEIGFPELINYLEQGKPS